MAVDLTIRPRDLYNTTVHQPLRTNSSSPLETYEYRDKKEEETFQGLLTDWKRNEVEGYFQSHPYDQIFTGRDLAVDEATLSNNYMRIIFGGRPDPTTDAIHMAYNHTIKDRAEAPTLKEDTLYELNPLSFVEAQPADKDSLLQTFAEQRMFWRGQIDSDTERMLKQRPTHELVHFTTYGKDITPGGQAGRFNYVTGQHGYLQFRPDTQNFYPYENLSSKTYAPMGDGREVPLDYQNVYGDDPRRIPITQQPKIDPPSPAAVFNFNDTGSYPGAEVDRYLTNYVTRAPPFASMFRQSAQRRWV